MGVKPAPIQKNGGPYSWVDVVVIVLLVALKEAFTTAGIPVFVPIGTYVAVRGIWHYAKRKKEMRQPSGSMKSSNDSLPMFDIANPAPISEDPTIDSQNHEKNTPEKGSEAINILFKNGNNDFRKSIKMYFYYSFCVFIGLILIVFWINRFDYKIPMKIDGARSGRQNRFTGTVEGYFDQKGWIDIHELENKLIIENNGNLLKGTATLNHDGLVFGYVFNNSDVYIREVKLALTLHKGNEPIVYRLKIETWIPPGETRSYSIQTPVVYQHPYAPDHDFLIMYFKYIK